MVATSAGGFPSCEQLRNVLSVSVALLEVVGELAFSSPWPALRPAC